MERERQKERRGLSLSPLFKPTQPSQMAVFSCMRLKDVSDSRCRFLGKLIFQAKLFLFCWRAGVVCVCVPLIKAPPLCLRRKDRSCLQIAGKAKESSRCIVSLLSESQRATDAN